MTNVQHPDFQRFVESFDGLVSDALTEPQLLDRGEALLKKLIANDAWLPEQYAEAGPTYRQYLLHLDPAERFSIVSFVWGPGQKAPVHNHTVWGLVGVLRGEEIAQGYTFSVDGSLAADGAPAHLFAGEVDRVSPTEGDVHSVANALPDEPSISIHVYGANIGRVQRASFQPDGTAKAFVSGYTNA
jgi:predicted metal-dependent enzyme (double-stranded beta helix superfamily)